MEKIEYKLADSTFELAGDEGTFQGYAAHFGNIDAGGDMIAPGAFSAWLGKLKNGELSRPVMYVEHDPRQLPVGTWLDFAEDGRGLLAKGKLADTTTGNDIYKLMKMVPHPALSGLSIGYIVQESSNRVQPTDPRRTLKQLSVVEVSVVSRPMNDRARVTGVKTTARAVEAILRDAGLSRSEAKAIVCHGIKAVTDQRDAEADELARVATLIRHNIELLKGV